MLNSIILKRYLIWVFLIAWLLQVIAIIAYNNNSSAIYSLTLSISMFAPLVAAIIARSDIKEIGWKPIFKGNIKYLFTALFLLPVLGIIGAVLYYFIVPSAFDTNLSYFVNSINRSGVDTLKTVDGLKMYIIITVVSSLTYAPFINMFFAIGEEAGWRGIMYPLLKDIYGKSKGLIIGGTIWGIWHWPVIIFAGYEYGKDYFGAPVLGPILFCIIAIAMGTYCDWIYERTKCIWYPALLHGSINAFAGIPTLFLHSDYSDQLILGPLMIGIISGLPMIIGAFILLKSKNNN